MVFPGVQRRTRQWKELQSLFFVIGTAFDITNCDIKLMLRFPINL